MKWLLIPTWFSRACLKAHPSNKVKCVLHATPLPSPSHRRSGVKRFCVWGSVATRRLSFSMVRSFASNLAPNFALFKPIVLSRFVVEDMSRSYSFTIMFNYVSFSFRRLLVAFWWKRKLKRNEAKYQISRKVILLPGKSHNSFDLATCRVQYASNTNFVFQHISAIIIAGKLRTDAEAAIWQQNNSNHPSKMKLTKAHFQGLQYFPSRWLR